MKVTMEVVGINEAWREYHRGIFLRGFARRLSQENCIDHHAYFEKARFVQIYNFVQQQLAYYLLVVY